MSEKMRDLEEKTQGENNLIERLRVELVLRNIMRHLSNGEKGKNNLITNLPAALLGNSLRILDCGVGNGAFAIPFAVLGHHILAIDTEAEALQKLKQKAEALNLTTRLKAHHNSLFALAKAIAPGTFDMIFCHNVLEFVEDPLEALDALVPLLKPDGLFSLLYANRIALPLHQAIINHNLSNARHLLGDEFYRSEFFEATLSAFTPNLVNGWLQAEKCKIEQEYGVLIFGEYLREGKLGEKLDEKVAGNFIEANFNLLLGLEEEAASRDPYKYIGTYIHTIARRKIT